MPAMNQKNMQISGAAFDLGIGQSATMQEQMQAKMEEIRKKRKYGQLDQMSAPASMMLLNPNFGGNSNG